jgi:hypothetical protein
MEQKAIAQQRAIATNANAVILSCQSMTFVEAVDRLYPIDQTS